MEGLLFQQIGAFALPLVTKAVEKFIEPKIKTLSEMTGEKLQIAKHVFVNTFEKTLLYSYKKHSVLNTIVFNNQQKLLKDLYIPLTIKTSSTIEETIDDRCSAYIKRVKKVLITDTAGMGKSTIMKKIFLSTVEMENGIPVMVELRRLGKDKLILDEILEQLNTVKKPTNKALVLELIEKGDFVFLLDGYDEISLRDKAIVTKNIQDFISKANNNCFVIASRPEGALASFGDFLKYTILPLRKEQSYELLRKYNDYGELAERLIAKIKERENDSIDEFLINPLLTSLLYNAFEHKQTIPFKKHIFYRQVFDAFFDTHDISKGDSYVRDKISEIDSDDFHKMLRYMGFYCMKRSRIEFNKDELLNIISEAKTFSAISHVQPNLFLKDLLISVPLFVLDGIYFKWAHRSIQEYFAAQFIYIDAKSQQKEILLKLVQNPAIEKHLNVLDLYYSIDFKSFRKIVVKSLIEEYLFFSSSQYRDNVIADELRTERIHLCFEKEFLIFVTDNAVDHTSVKSGVPSKLRGDKKEFIIRQNVLKGGGIWILYVHHYRHWLMSMLYGKGHPLVLHPYIKKSASPTENEKLMCRSRIRYDMPKDIYFPINDKKEMPFNFPDNFDDTNKLIKLAFYSNEHYRINISEADKILKEIQDEISLEDKTNFLLDGL
ncbi:NACHT domain-containing protein [Segetibacter aerophilus]|uniref:Uncharacterized protein n=1 Tax=Segetibacter aerophilus TaxID=670293 RepID=A0A512BHV3_9BACT|nr:NACHT domain-containing protein [Segetibacter aerophilus]GEO11533.1 hypothetical protein SAE01_40290 [Segetibacter aerophilus]